MFGRSRKRPSLQADLAPGTRGVLEFARAEAVAMNHGYLGTEHILLGLMRKSDSRAARVLGSRLPDLGVVRQEVLQLTGRGPVVAIEHVSFTARARVVLEFARREVDLYRMEQVAPEHLLIGILREGEGTAMQVMMRLGVDDFGLLRAEAAERFPRPRR